MPTTASRRDSSGRAGNPSPADFHRARLRGASRSARCHCERCGSSSGGRSARRSPA